MEKSELIKKIEGFQIGNELLYDDLKTITSMNESFFKACGLIGQMKSQLELVKIYLEHCKIEEK